jgi:class 3 adenylate cyclase
VSQTIDTLDAARDAVSRHAWRVAYASYGDADAAALTADDLEKFAEAAWWSGKLDDAINLRERAYAAFSSGADARRAARVALALSWDHSGRGEFAVSQGWFATAERLLADAKESAEYGVLTLIRAVNTMFAVGDPSRAIPDFDRAFELAQRFGDRDTQALALVGKGRALIKAGEVEQGLALLDEATAAAVCGQVGPFSTGIVYCITISSCHDLGDYRRAAEWTEAANRWCDRLDVSGFPGACRIHRAEIMRLRGDLAGAEKQAMEACEELGDFERAITAGGYYEIGEIRRRRGELAAAEEAYRTSNELGRDPQPGLALLRLVEGKVDAAVAGITRTLQDMQEPLARLRRLPAQVEIAVAANDVGAARTALAEFEEIADSYRIDGRRTPAFDATAQFASGQIKLAENDVAGAATCLRLARDEWQRVGAPYETGRARMLLAGALRRQGDEHAAVAELEAALGMFERVGARLEAARAKELLGQAEVRRTFLFTDIVDSTRLLETLGADKWKRLLARHNELLRERIVENGGEVIKQTGDGFFASFESPKAAIEAAVAIQRALDTEIVAPDVRIGAHTGDAFATDGETRDFGGAGVHTAARIGAAAGRAEILVSTETLDGIASTFRLSEPRVETLKGMELPVEVVAVDWR